VPEIEDHLVEIDGEKVDPIPILRKAGWQPQTQEGIWKVPLRVDRKFFINEFGQGEVINLDRYYTSEEAIRVHVLCAKTVRVEKLAAEERRKALERGVRI
jgi:hypothetical protein